ALTNRRDDSSGGCPRIGFAEKRRRQLPRLVDCIEDQYARSADQEGGSQGGIRRCCGSARFGIADRILKCVVCNSVDGNESLFHRFRRIGKKETDTRSDSRLEQRMSDPGVWIMSFKDTV